MKCRNCEYGNIVLGECRRHAPTPDPRRNGAAYWPRIEHKREHGCGEWKALPRAQQVYPEPVKDSKPMTGSRVAGQPRSFEDED